MIPDYYIATVKQCKRCGYVNVNRDGECRACLTWESEKPPLPLPELASWLGRLNAQTRDLERRLELKRAELNNELFTR